MPNSGSENEVVKGFLDSIIDYLPMKHIFFLTEDTIQSSINWINLKDLDSLSNLSK